MSGFLLVVDLSTKSAFIVDQDGRTKEAWSGVTRRTAICKAVGAGWYMTGVGWALTSPPDGYWRPVTRRPWA